MKKFPLLSCIFLLALCACKKEKDTPKSNDMVYALSGPEDTVYTYAALSQPISVTYTSGDKSTVQLSLSGLPKGLNARFADTAGTPAFATSLHFSHDDYIVPGTYPVTISAKAASTQSLSFSMTVKGSCGNFMSGTYRTEITYASSGEQFNNTQYTALTKDGNPDRLYFYEGKNTEPDFYGDVDCASGTLNIPVQNKPGSTLQYSGSGTLATKTHSMSFTMVYDGLPSLKFVLSRP